jgi:hypothetical protein
MGSAGERQRRANAGGKQHDELDRAGGPVIPLPRCSHGPVIPRAPEV